MPVYRPQRQYLAEAIDSVLGQTLSDLELVIVEDPSDATGRDLVEQRRDPRIRYILNEQRTGLARQHNRAVCEARGQFIARFDADDICEPDRLEKQVAYLEAHPDIDVVACQLRIIDDSGTIIGRRDYPQEHDEIVRAMRRYNPISGSNATFRRHVPAEVGGWREGIDRPAQDYEWYSRVATRGHRFAILPEPLIRYRRHGSQIKARKLRGTLLTTLEVKRLYWLKTMDPVSLLLFACEASMLLLPASVVLWLFKKLRYK
jgi:glycosyltransferase involved in cell wall biosynthesis